jgi:hypothetical protein
VVEAYDIVVKLSDDNIDRIKESEYLALDNA